MHMHMHMHMHVHVHMDMDTGAHRLKGNMHRRGRAV